MIVNAKGGTLAFRGVLWREEGLWLVLRNAEKLGPNNEVVPVDGEVLVAIGDVDFVQVL